MVIFSKIEIKNHKIIKVNHKIKNPYISIRFESIYMSYNNIRRVKKLSFVQDWILSRGIFRIS